MPEAISIVNHIVDWSQVTSLTVKNLAIFAEYSRCTKQKMKKSMENLIFCAVMQLLLWIVFTFSSSTALNTQESKKLIIMTTHQTLSLPPPTHPTPLPNFKAWLEEWLDLILSCFKIFNHM